MLFIFTLCRHFNVCEWKPSFDISIYREQLYYRYDNFVIDALLIFNPNNVGMKYPLIVFGGGMSIWVLRAMSLFCPTYFLLQQQH